MSMLIDSFLQSDALGLIALASGLLLLVADLATAPRLGSTPSAPPTSAGHLPPGQQRRAA